MSGCGGLPTMFFSPFFDLTIAQVVFILTLVPRKVRDFSRRSREVFVRIYFIFEEDRRLEEMKKIVLLTAILALGIFGLGCPPAGEDTNNATTTESPAASPEASAEATPAAEASPAAEGEKKEGDEMKKDGDAEKKDGDAEKKDGEAKEGEAKPAS